MASVLDTPAPRRSRKYLRISTRALILLTLAIGGGLGFWLHEVRVQRDAVATIRKANGWAGYDWEWKGGKSTPKGKPPVPGWLVDRLGVDSFGSVRAVNLGRLWRGGIFPDLRNMSVVLPHVGRLRRLECLVLRASAITDADLAHLEGSTTLRWLQLKSTDLGDAGLAHLKNLTRLQWLDLSNTKVTDAGLLHLQEMTELEKLELNGTQISDAGLSHLRNLAKLKSLSLDQTRVAGPGLVHLKQLPDLKHLSLNRNMINEAGIEQLKEFAGLEMLSITKLQASDVAMAELQRELPNVRIAR
jgi:Leucine Rich repeat